MSDVWGLLSNVSCVLWDKQVALIVGQTDYPYCGTNRLPLLWDKQVTLIGGQTGCPYWGTDRLPFWGDKQVVLIGGQTGGPYWGTNWLPFLGDKQVALLGWQIGCPYCPTSWHFCSRSVETKNENLHEHGLRFVMNDYDRSYQELSTIANCDTMLLWRLKKIAVFMFKYLIGHNPKYLCDMFSAKDTSYENRNIWVYHGKTLLYAGAKLWNSLPVCMKTSSTFNLYILYILYPTQKPASSWYFIVYHIRVKIKCILILIPIEG